MKLEVGMHCYNKTNRKLGIGKIISFQRNNNANIKYKNDIELVSVGNVEASHNIIDLIKIGDYVNGFKVTGLDYQYTTKVHKLSCNNEYGQEGILIIPSEIRNVVTKEQFDSMKYEVDSNE